MSERRDPAPALFNPDVLAPADQEILETMEKAIGSIDFPLELQTCSECGSKCGGWIPKGSPNDDSLYKTPVVFCLPYPCAYNWNQRNKVTGRNVVFESKRIAGEVDKISSSTPRSLLGGRSEALSLEDGSVSPAIAAPHVVESKKTSGEINHRLLNIEGLMANRVGQENESSNDISYELRNSFETTATPVEPASNSPTSVGTQGRKLLERSAHQEPTAKRKGAVGVNVNVMLPFCESETRRHLTPVGHFSSSSESDSEVRVRRLRHYVSSDSEESIGDWAGSSLSSESTESELELGGQDQSREEAGNRRKAASKRSARNLSSSPEANSTEAVKGLKRAKRPKGHDAEGISEPIANFSCAKLDTSQSAETQTKPIRRQIVSKVRGVEGTPEVYRPSEWWTGTVPKRIPYFPQLGDELVYFRQGHELYVKQVTNSNIFPLDRKLTSSVPYVQDPDLPAVISVRVVQIEFQLIPPRLVKLKLARTKWTTGTQLGSFLHVRYHYLPSVPEFLVLKQIYDKSVRNSWRSGDRFRCMIEKTWWIGTVVMRKPFDSDMPQSTFRSYLIRWGGDDQDTNQLSPWDMEIIPDDFVVPEDAVQNGVPATDEEMRNPWYESTAKDWKHCSNQESEVIVVKLL